MYSNAPTDYVCPVCLGVSGTENDKTLLRATDVVFKDDVVTVFINSFFMGKNARHVIIVPNHHYENIYDMPNEVGQHIFDISKRMALALKKSYSADGITIRQNNEPAGDQHAFHYHLHVYPRYENDGFNEILPNQKRLAELKERAEFADKLKAVI